MKHITIHCAFLSAEQYALTLRQMVPESVENITVSTRFSSQITYQQIEDMVEVQKQFSQDRPVRFQNRGVFAQIPRLGKALRKVLRKNSFLLEFLVDGEPIPKLVKLAKRMEKSGIAYKFCLDEQQDQMAAYKRLAAHGLHTYFSDPKYTAESPDQFDEWLYDPKALGINTYCDIINMLVLQTHSPNCRHASCFGNVFFVDEKMDVYLCPNHPEERTKLGCLTENVDLNTLLNSQAVANLLPVVVQKRQNCTETCTGFCYCQGGCLLEAADGNDCVHYLATVERIRQRLLEVYRDGKIAEVNYVVKNAILNAIAFGTAFLN